MLHYKEIGASTVITVSDYKDYARIVPDTQEGLLASILRTATLRIAEYVNAALLPVTIEDIGEGSEIRLYELPVQEVLYVRDAERADIDLTPDVTIINDKVILPYFTNYIIEYQCLPDAGMVERYKLSIYELASAIYDGDAEEQNKVFARL